HQRPNLWIGVGVSKGRLTQGREIEADACFILSERDSVFSRAEFNIRQITCELAPFVGRVKEQVLAFGRTQREARINARLRIEIRFGVNDEAARLQHGTIRNPELSRFAAL